MRVDWGKLITLLAVILCATVAFSLGKLSESGWLAIVGPIVGYIAGNGRLAAKGMVSQPMLAPRHVEDPDA